MAIPRGGDFFFRNSPEAALSADLIAYETEWYFQHGIGHWNNQFGREHMKNLEEDLNRQSCWPGMLQMDQVHQIGSSEEIRKKYGIPQDKKIILVLPWTTYVGGFWSDKVFCEKNRFKAIANTILKRRWEYLKSALWGRNYEAIKKSLLKLEKNNDALIVIKTRDKVESDPFFKNHIIVSDDSYYPATILELMKISSLCVSIRSGSVRESAFMGVPKISISYEIEWLDRYSPEQLKLERLLYNDEEGSLFKFQDAITDLSIEKAIQELPHLKIQEMKVCSKARQNYIEKFVGNDVGDSSERLINEIQKRIYDRNQSCYRN